MMTFPIYGKIKHVPNHKPVAIPRIPMNHRFVQAPTLQGRIPKRYVIGLRWSKQVDVMWMPLDTKNIQNMVGFNPSQTYYLGITLI